ncbi:MAG: hypothetical protein JXR52_12065 [Bacteroidales bacterium]|nr:hypothetical protein [Bacteroidales bacterium]
MPWLCLLTGIVSIAEAQIPVIRQDLMDLNRLNLNEQIYLHTDCEVYAPGDTIWFQAYIRNKYSLKKSNLSNIFHLNLVGKNGTILSHDRYLITDSRSSGCLAIDNNQPDGYYVLYCYSSWMKNFDPEQVYQKEILIIRDINKGNRMVPHFDRAYYRPGDTVKVMVKYYDELNGQMEGSRFRYRLLTGKEVMARGGAHSSATESNPLEFIMPDSLAGSPVLEIWDNTLSASFDIPLNRDIRVDFFPEGGNCLNNVSGIMAFKAVYADSRPAEVRGIIVDDAGDVLADVRTDHDGMGQFPYHPQENKKVYLEITHPAVPGKIYPLPAGEAYAWTIHANAFKDRLHIEIKNNLPAFDTCLFVLSIRDFSDYFMWIRSESGLAFVLPTAEFPAGIAVLTLLDRNRVPLAERLVFINHDRSILPVLETDRKKYLCRDPVILAIGPGPGQKPFREGQYSLTVYDEKFGGSGLIDEPNIIASSYLRPEIKGEILNPNYYFLSDNQETRYHLDLLMLTQGWRRYRYQVLYRHTDSLEFPRNRDEITGQVKRSRYGRDPVPEAAELTVYFSGNWVSLFTEENGRFSILPEYSVDHLSPVIISARDRKGSGRVIVEMDSDPFQERLKGTLRALPDSAGRSGPGKPYIFEDINRILNVNTSRSIWLEEVKITRNIRPDTIDLNEELVKSLYSVRTADELVLSTSNDIFQIVMSMGFNCNLDVENDRLMVYFQGEYVPVRFMVDGFDMGEAYSDINAFYSPREIESLYLARGFDAFVMYRNYAVVYIKSRFRAGYDDSVDERDKNYAIIPVLKVGREFYSPAYRTEEERNFPVPDIRKTIYWEPDVRFDENGTARIVFFNSDRYTRVRCILEGITDTGIPVHGETSYDITIYRE